MPKKTQKIYVIGAGLAGSEAAFQLARAGYEVHLHEMRPEKMTEAHQTQGCAELVCSNSLKSKDPVSAPGMLKAEMMTVGSLILQAAEAHAVPGGQALTVDREKFSEEITRTLKSHANIRFYNGEIREPFADGLTLIATGPLTSHEMSTWLAGATGEKDLYFYDAIAPIIDATSIDPEKSFLANRYGKGGEDAYINCPMDKEEYEAFIDALLAGEKVTPKNFEKEIFFQGCQPIEAIAATGRDSLRFGPMKPVGLTDPKTGKRPWAVIQLRPENLSKTAYNLVGFQTKLKYGEQVKIFKMIPALRNAEFLRLGSIHRNTYVCGPKVLNADLSLKTKPNVFLAGQITGVEGYLESAACGMLASLFIQQRLKGQAAQTPPPNTALGSLHRYITGSEAKHYQPMNANFSLFEPSDFQGVSALRRDDARQEMAKQAIVNFQNWFRNESPRPL